MQITYTENYLQKNYKNKIWEDWLSETCVITMQYNFNCCFYINKYLTIFHKDC